tara:strand:- start:5081 stop:5266 length:186 start_codon:yes stop_codon:yes gene_type:complete
MSNKELEIEYLDYLDEIGEGGIPNYGLLLKKADPVAYNLGYTDFLEYEESTKELLAKLNRP